MFVEEEEEKNMDEIFSGVVTGETTASIAAYNSGPGRFGLLEQSLEIKAEEPSGNRSQTRRRGETRGRQSGRL